MRKSRTIVLLVVSIAMLGLLSAACGGVSVDTDGDGATIETPEGDITVDEEGGDVSIETPEGEAQFETGGDIPENFPDDIPLPDDYTVETSGSFSGDTADGGSLVNVSLRVSGSPQDVVDFYSSALPGEGWTIQSTINTPDGNSITAQKGERFLSVIVSSDGSDTLLVLSEGQQ